RVQLFRDPVEAFDVSRRHDDFSALASRHFRGRKTDPGGATDYNDLLACEQHAFSSIWSGRLIAGADAGLALPEPGQFPDAGAHRVDVGGDIDVDQIGLVGGNPLADRLADIAGTVDADALDAAGARHRGEVRIVALARRRIVEVGRE